MAALVQLDVPVPSYSVTAAETARAFLERLQAKRGSEFGRFRNQVLGAYFLVDFFCFFLGFFFVSVVPDYV